MSDQKIRELTRRFAGGDEEAGARLAGEMLRARSLFNALGSLSPALQASLAGITISEGIQEQITAALADGISVEEIAAEIDISDLAGNIDHSEIASEMTNHIDASDVAQNIEESEVADALDKADLVSHLLDHIHNELDVVTSVAATIELSDLADEISVSDLAAEIDLSDVAHEIDLSDLGTHLMESIRTMVDEAVEEALDARE